MHSTQENSEQQRHLLVGGLLVLEVIPVQPAGLTTLQRENHIWEHQMEILQNDTPKRWFLLVETKTGKNPVFPFAQLQGGVCHNVAGAFAKT